MTTMENMENLEQDTEKFPEAVRNVAGQIMEIKAEVAAMGANSSELGLIDEVMEKLQNGEVDPEEALQQVKDIRDNKNDNF